jgi:phosphoribosylformylglycinamidine synthase I
LAEVRLSPPESMLAAPSVFRIELVEKTDQRKKPYQQSRLYFLDGMLSIDQLHKIASELLANPLTETFHISAVDRTGALQQTLYGDLADDMSSSIEVALLPGVTDSVAETLLSATHLLDIAGLEQAATDERYVLKSALSADEIRQLAESLYNPTIQHVAIDCPIAPRLVPYQPVDSTVEFIPVRAASDNALRQIISERRLALDLAEMQAIRDYFEQEGRDPSDAELEMLAQTWSEHCVHKTFKVAIEYSAPAHGAAADSAPTTQIIDDLLKTYIRATTDKLPKSWVRSAFVDNAGIVAFDDHYDLAFKVETHNHPSALEPFGGANTGVGGVVRDVLGVSARPIANTDILCFGLPDTSDADLPSGTLHPRRIAGEVIHGVADYGNKMGIPTVNGAILYHPCYIANPLVFCGCLGLLSHGAHSSGTPSGDLIVVIGGRLGADVDLANLANASNIADAATLLYSESLSRLIVEIRPDAKLNFESLLTDIPCTLLGTVSASASLNITSSDHQELSLPVSALETGWRGEQSAQSVEITPPPPAAARSFTRAIRNGTKRILVLHANGSNRDHEAALACELAGAESTIIHVNRLLDGEENLLDYHMLVVPGGFSYGDDLGAGTRWALDLQRKLQDGIQQFVAEGRPVLGICNGFQALVKSGLLPGSDTSTPLTVTLTYNEAAHFECRWVYLQPSPASPCLFTEGLDEPIYFTVAHGEGRLVTADSDTLDSLWVDGLAALTYVNADGTGAAYPLNPKGSQWVIAGLCNHAGNVFGLMPHPEDYAFFCQHPRWRRGMDGLSLFSNRVKYA